VTDPPILPEFYQARAAVHRETCRRLGRKSRLLSNLRGLTFATSVIGWGFSLFGSAGLPGAALGTAAFLAFVILVVAHARVIAAESLQARWVSVNDDAAARVSPDTWHDLPNNGEQFRDPLHRYADDLDLFGRASLFQRLCVAKTHRGQIELATFLLEPATPNEIRARQAMIQGLAPLLELRQKLEVLARATQTLPSRGEAKALPANLQPLFAWGEGEALLSKQPWFRWTARLLPIVTTVLLGLGYLGKVSVFLGLLALVGHLLVLLRTRQLTAPLVSMLSTSEQTVLEAERLLDLLEHEPAAGVVRDTLDRDLDTATVRPSTACKTLRRIAGWFEFRHNGLIYPFANLYLLWDLQCAIAFDAWRNQYGRHLRRWFSAIGRTEALSSLAGFYHDEANGCLAEIAENEVLFEAEALGHPLIHAQQRVTNDVDVLQSGCGLLVTGSNMSGKSTFLRAIGLGAVLGLAGGPVCAKRLRLSPLTVATSMRVADSLVGGVSHFYAELRKLKAVLTATEDERRVLFLLDEILHGTNSRERHVGARWILSHLLRSAALGAVSTHDLSLCELSGDLASRLRLVHFRENVVDDQMTFDYVLREGPVTAGNALRLMRSLGLAVPLTGE
jgi:hypothetical protein